MTENNETQKPPIQTFEAWPIKIKVWQNTTSPTDNTPEKNYYQATLERSYKNKDSKFGNSGSLRKQDLLAAAHELAKAYDYILEKEKEDFSNEETTE